MPSDRTVPLSKRTAPSSRRAAPQGRRARTVEEGLGPTVEEGLGTAARALRPRSSNPGRPLPTKRLRNAVASETVNPHASAVRVMAAAVAARRAQRVTTARGRRGATAHPEIVPNSKKIESGITQSILGIRRSSFSSRKHLYSASIICNLRLIGQV